MAVLRVSRAAPARGWKPMLPILLGALVLSLAFAQEDEAPPPEAASKPPVAITFTPPALEGRIVLGIFDAAGKLVRTLRFEPGAPELAVETNGYVAKWDGRDEAGTACPGGRYAARGYVVGSGVRVEGEAFHFNDWVAEDEIAATGVTLRAWPESLGVEVATPGAPVLAQISAGGELITVSRPPSGAAFGDAGWKIVEDAGQRVVVQVGADGSAERALRVPKEEPQPVEILAAGAGGPILLRETGAAGWERVRMLRRGGKSEEKEGKVVADWEVIFERTRQPCANFGVLDGKLVPDAGNAEPEKDLTVSLVENLLEPGKKETLRLAVASTHPGSALVTPDGLKLVEISAEGNWSRFAVSPGAEGDHRLYEGDGLVVEEFLIGGLDQIAAFDAGTFLLAPAAQ